MKIKYTSKDLINIGIFSAIFIVVNIIISGFVVTPILQFIMMPVMALLCAPIYLLYIAKVGKLGAITITGLLASALVGLLVYGNVYCFLVNITFFILAEVIACMGNYKNNKLNSLSYIIVSFWAIGEAGLPWWGGGKIFYDLSLASGYSEEFAIGVNSLATPLNLIIMLVSVVVCAIISIIFAKSMFKKHFKKAGIV